MFNISVVYGYTKKALETKVVIYKEANIMVGKIIFFQGHCYEISRSRMFF